MFVMFSISDRRLAWLLGLSTLVGSAGVLLLAF